MTFTYRASDASLNSNTANAVVTITPVNDIPVITGQTTLTTLEDTALTIVLANLTVTDVDNTYPTGFSLTLQAGSNYTFVGATITPAANFNGTLTVPVTVSDGSGGTSAPFSLTITVSPVNDAPVCFNVALTVNEDTAGDVAPSCTDVDGDTLTYSIVAQGASGTASVAAGQLHFVPAANINGSVTFTYRANDGTVFSNTANAVVTITPVNDAPVCSAVALTVNEDTAGDVAPSCTDVDGDTLTYSIVAQGASGTASVVAGQLHFVPAANINGSVTFTYRASDASLNSNTANAVVTITPVNDAPVCSAVALTVNEDTAGDVAPSCTDVDGDTLTYSIVAQGASGTASVVAGQLHFVPAANINGSVTFTYRASDASLNSNTANAVVTITPVNDAPVCSAVALTVNEDTAGDVAPSCTDVDGDTLTYCIVAQGASGTASVVAGQLHFVPAANINGSVTFTYRASDASLNSNTANAVVTITPVNDIPVITGQTTLTTLEDTALTIVLANLTVTDVDNTYPTGFSLTLQAGSNYTFVGATITPAANFNGTLTVPVTVSDGSGGTSAPFSLTITVSPLNDAPVCFNVALTVNEDTAGDVAPSCTDVDGDTLTYSIVAQGASGTASVAAGQLHFVPAANINGSVTFTYRANDGTVFSNTANAVVTITPVNDAPVCSAVALTVNEDTAGDVAPSCTDVDGDTLTYSIVAQGASGTASVVAGQLHFVPAANINGSVTFTYRASDASLNSNTANAVVTITPVNDAPVCSAVALTVNEDTAGDVAPSCTDVDGDTLTYSIVAQGTSGTASVVAGQLHFVPAANINGSVTFTYRASDASLNSNTANAVVTITPVNDAPVCSAVALTVNEDTAGDVAPSCTDVDGDTLTYSIVAQGASGTASVVGSQLHYVPAANVNGSVTFTYRANDGTVFSNTSNAVVTITPVNDAPVCSAVALTVNEDTAGDVAPSCTDVDGDTLTYSIVAQGASGTASVVAGQLHFVPAANVNGSVTFTYRANDGTAFSNTANAVVTITPVNDAPVCSAVALTVNEDTAGDVAPSCTDVDGDTLTYSIVAQGASGTASVVAGQLHFVPAANVNGSVTFTYRANDGTANSNTANAVVTITPVNDAPVCSAVALTVNEDTAGDVAPSCTDAEGDTLTYSIVAQGTSGTASVVAGQLHFVPAANINGSVTFTYRANDGTVFSNTSNAVVTITPVNDAPIITEGASADVTMSVNGVPNPFALTLHATDVDTSDTLTWSILTQATHGTATAAGTGTSMVIGYTPVTDYAGSDSFVVQVSDGNGGLIPSLST